MPSYEVFPATDIPKGCVERIETDKTGSWKVIVFPDGSEMDAALAPFWRHLHPNWETFIE